VRITIKCKDVFIEVSEEGEVAPRQVTMRYENENKYIQETLKVMTEQVEKLCKLELRAKK
jgi:hypothetical protein